MRIEVKNLIKNFSSKSWILTSRKQGTKKAVDDVSFSIKEKEMFGLIGDSGCGKTTIARTISALLRPTAGEVLYDGESIFEMNKKRFRKFRQEVRAIFQNPDSCLNPHMKIKDIIAEVFKIHTNLRKKEIDKEIHDLFELMGLSLSFLKRYPYQLSIGQKRKIGLARALAIVPKFLIADEPFAGLDVSTKRELTSIMQKLQQTYKFGALIISHDLESVRNLCHRVAVMYKGKIIELFDYAALIDKEVYHPYTQILLKGKKQEGRTLILKGKFHSPLKEDMGCRFLNHCYLYKLLERPSLCSEKQPKLRSVQDNHQVACHFCSQAHR
ncbi:MAG: oligopeptide/dipeptide ABC transporter ATP-binding protein [Candidatus Zixiibacteriota bacterium]